MQESFGFASNDIAAWSSRLITWHGDPLPVPRRTPLGQLVKSIISGRTYDAVSAGAYGALAECFPDLGAIADAPATRVQALIADVTFPEAKAAHLIRAMGMIRAARPDCRLEFLGAMPMADALAWLERLPGVARKVAASTLNASTLNRPVLIVDSHVLRVLSRLGFVDRQADFQDASESATAAMPTWNGDDFLRFHILMKRLGQTVCVAGQKFATQIGQ